MKYIAVILLLCVLGLTLQPLMPHISITKHQITKIEKSCCSLKHSTHQKKKDKSSDDCCSNGGCTMFGSCGCCVGFCPYPPTFKFKSLAIINVMNAHVEQFTSYDITLDSFHPPESA